MAHLMRTQPYMVHTTFQYGGAQGKRHRLREAMIWEDDEAYYNPPQGLLRFEVDIPEDLVYPNGADGVDPATGTLDFARRHSVAQHFALVHHQLAQIRDALALARALGRVLILPRLVCGLDRYWAPHDGIIPGSATRLPLLECPADHVIDLERMGKPETTLREHTLLCNPRTPKAVLDGARGEAIRDRIGWDEGAYGQLQARRAGRALAERLRAAHGERGDGGGGGVTTTVLELSGPLPDYRAVLPKEELVQFEETLQSYASLWCCNMPPGGRGPGHVWYDFLWDVVPHRDRHGRVWDSGWTPKMGP